MDPYSDVGEILTSFLDGLPWPALLVNEQGDVTFVNKELKDRGWIPASLSGTHLSQLFPEHYAALHGAQPWLETQDVDVLRPHSTAPERLCVRRLPLGACIIVTEQPRSRDLDLGSAQTARLAALGFMVAGVCHEVANPLTAIHSMVQLLQSSRPLAQETLERGLANVAGNVQRVLGITRRLNEFSRTGGAKTHLRVDQVVAAALQNVAQEAQFHGIDVAHESGPELWISGSDGQLEQVFANIFLNAAQAMNGAGYLRVSSRVLNRLQCEIAVRDSGPGIAPGHLPHLFEPFFTTKPAGHGTGLGLAISNEIVIEHGGSLRAENHPAGGACFYVRLPLRERR